MIGPLLFVPLLVDNGLVGNEPVREILNHIHLRKAGGAICKCVRDGQQEGIPNMIKRRINPETDQMKK